LGGHKEECAPGSRVDARHYERKSTMVNKYVLLNYFALMKEMERVSREAKLGVNDLLLELDFRAGEDGESPALKDPPEFRVCIGRQYMSGPVPKVRNRQYFHVQY